jgi:hypothetical protein
MFNALEQHERQIGRLAWFAAWFGLVAGQLHALSRHRTEDGKSDLDLPLTKVWAEPADDLLSPLLDWASADAVYLTYGKLWLPVFIAFTLCAFVVRRNRRPAGFEKWAWRVALTGYVGACVSAFGEFWLMWGSVNDALLDGVFLVIFPFMLLTMIGSTMLGIALLRRGVKLPAWLLVAAVPGFLVITELTSMGNVVLPVAFAFGVWGRRIARDEAASSAPRDLPNLTAMGH